MYVDTCYLHSTDNFNYWHLSLTTNHVYPDKDKRDASLDWKVKILFFKLSLFSFLHISHKDIILIFVNECKLQRAIDKNSKSTKVKAALYISTTFLIDLLISI